QVAGVGGIGLNRVERYNLELSMSGVCDIPGKNQHPLSVYGCGVHVTNGCTKQGITHVVQLVRRPFPVQQVERGSDVGLWRPPVPLLWTPRSATPNIATTVNTANTAVTIF